MGPEVFYSRVLGFRVLLEFTLRISGSGFRRRLWVLGHPVLDGASVCELYQHYNPEFCSLGLRVLGFRKFRVLEFRV